MIKLSKILHQKSLSNSIRYIKTFIDKKLILKNQLTVYIKYVLDPMSQLIKCIHIM